MGKKLLIALCCLFSANLALANNDEELVTVEQAVAFGNRVMMDISRGKAQQAWRKVKANSTIPPERVDAFAEDYNNRVVQTIQYFGTPLGVELVDQQAFGRSLLRVSYLVRYNVTAVVWYMYFYRVGNDWAISEFNYDLNSNTLFSLAAKASSQGDNALLMQAWQEKMEARIAALEGGGGGGGGGAGGSFSIDPSKIKGDNATALILLELQARILTMEQKIKDYGEANQRLAAVEGKVESMGKQFNEITYQLDLNELARMRKLLHQLKEQHPFAKFTE